MRSLEEIKKLWGEDSQKGKPAEGKEAVKHVIHARVKKEKKVVMEYFWATFVYHVMIYAFMTHLFFRFWGDGQIMLLSVAGVSVYIPFTVILMRKFKAMARPVSNFQEQTMREHVQHQYRLLSEFFQFKRIFDWIGIPLSALIVVVIIFQLYVPGGVKGNFTGSVITLAVVLTSFATVTYFENRKRFHNPLHQLGSVLDELQTEQ